jgi:hypothetical protein
LIYTPYGEEEYPMNELKRKMIRKAVQQYNRIYPCGSKRYFSECFTLVDDSIVFWFNTEDRSTHLMTRKFGWQGGLHQRG